MKISYKGSVIMLRLKMGDRKAIWESSKYSELHQKRGCNYGERDLFPSLIHSYILNKITGKCPFTSIQTNKLLLSLNYYNIYSSHVCRFINKLRISYRAIHIDFCDIHHVPKFKITASLQNQKSVTKVVL